MSSFVKIEIPIEDARKLINELYKVDIPKSIYVNDPNNGLYLMENTEKLTPKQALEFYKEVIKLK